MAQYSLLQVLNKRSQQGGTIVGLCRCTYPLVINIKVKKWVRISTATTFFTLCALSAPKSLPLLYYLTCFQFSWYFLLILLQFHWNKIFVTTWFMKHNSLPNSYSHFLPSFLHINTSISPSFSWHYRDFYTLNQYHRVTSDWGKK